LDVAIDPVRVLQLINVRTLKQVETSKGSKLCTAAAGRGDFMQLKWLHERDCPWDDTTLIAAAKQGRADIVKWALKHDCPWHLGWCSPMDVPGYVQDALNSTTFAPHCETMDMTREAARCGSLPLLQWLRTLGCCWNEETCSAAAFWGHVEVLKWAHMHGCPWDKFTVYNAAIKGHLEKLQWAHQHGCPCGNLPSNGLVLHELARCGHMEMLRWLQCISQHPWTTEQKTDMLDTAAQHGHVDMIKLLREQGASWPGDMWRLCEELAAEWYPEHVLQWALADGTMWDTWQCHEMLS
jgi:hypothetical protein